MSHDDNRIRRPKLPRTAARRSLSVLFVPPAAASANGGTAPGAAGSEPWNDVIARSVELGYRVIDDYVRQGEQFARTFGGRAAPPPAAAPPFSDPQDFARRMSQYAMDVTTLWLQMLQGAQGAAPWSVFPGFAPPAGSGATSGAPPFPGFPAPTFANPAFGAPPFTPEAAPWTNGAAQPYGNGAATHAPSTPVSAPVRDVAASPRIAVAVSSVKLAEVVLDVRASSRANAIAVHALRDDDKPRIEDVGVTRDRETQVFLVRIRVPADQPPGVYRGAVVDAENGVSLGSLELRVGIE